MSLPGGVTCFSTRKRGVHMRRLSMAALLSVLCLIPSVAPARTYPQAEPPALHLVRQALKVLCDKGADISDDETEAVCAALLLHDIGHGPFSHALEHTLVDLHHETISQLFMQELNRQFDGRLERAIAVFNDQYPK